MKDDGQQREYDFLGRVASAASVPDFAAEVVPYCRDLFEAGSVLAVLFHRDRAPEVLFRWSTDRLRSENFDRNYPVIGYLLDPFYRIAFDGAARFAGPLREIAPDRFEASEYYDAYFGATRLSDELGAVARLGASRSLHLAVGRDRGQRRFRASEVARFDLLSRVLMPCLAALAPVPAPGVPLPPLRTRLEALALETGEQLSAREAQVAELILQGHSSRAMALKLGISVHTAKVHRRNLYRKMNISSQSELFVHVNRAIGLQAAELGAPG
ncbi:helix-turn-helix transcriptional regulator [Pseudooceanicola sp. CBS1P-1]|uniref:HTH luxR-type domain-containing protein n=1 Tax=Pseudooceanicola albus TaxID=2692189 RepID=A0A6L7G1Y8_9RHOB|nr:MULTISPECIES: helix-turn-helix transcriptional regulator [Pseudooceanicola]MBT9383591.1 helix-turn-helix transcriptional regulator [Pseudooceanicola endophyticus]MXN17446.1 hypothetical protein [Pseudooceanicola albus]